MAGIGVNVSNQPEVIDTGLKNHTTRLADLLATPPALRELAALLLGQLRRAVSDLQDQGFAALLPRINALWSGARRVELDLDGVLRSGLFSGIDEQGRLTLSEETGSRSAYAAHQVRHLQEI